ncbi:hypothetical protein [Streptomyces sp. NPDC054838]
MSRTAHHIRSRRRAGHPAKALCVLVLVHGLRYSARCRTEAARGGHRPRPRAVRRRGVARRLPRVLRDRSVHHWAAQEERRARQRLRADTRTLLRLTDRGPGRRLDLSRAEEADTAPARHRRAALRLA